MHVVIGGVAAHEHLYVGNSAALGGQETLASNDRRAEIVLADGKRAGGGNDLAHHRNGGERRYGIVFVDGKGIVIIEANPIECLPGLRDRQESRLTLSGCDCEHRERNQKQSLKHH